MQLESMIDGPRKNPRDFSGIPMSVSLGTVVFILLTFTVATSTVESKILVFVTSVVAAAFVLTFFLINHIMAKPDGTPEMREVADAIRKGAQGFFRVQFGTIFWYSLVVAVVIYVGYLYRPAGDLKISPNMVALITAFSFLFGAWCSALAGYCGLYICVRVNARVAAAARKSFKDCMQTALLGGAIPAILVLALVVLGIVFLYSFMESFVVGRINLQEKPQEPPLLLVGYGFGASFVALFAQLGGGIYTKAADVGADLVGKVEAGLDEDDPRNPAVVADLVGDNVGDCAGRGADLFESIAAEIVAAMVLGGSMAAHSGLPASGFVMFPLVVHAFDLVVSTFGIAFAYCLPPSAYHSRQPLAILKKGYYAACAAAGFTFWMSCQWLLHVPGTNAATNYFWCGVCGMLAAVANVSITQYYTDYVYFPVESIAEAAKSGHATTIITGSAVGMESTCLPSIVVSAALLGSYYLGEAAGIVDKSTGAATGGLFGTAVATMGMLSTAVYVLTMDFFGPIADNAGGIVEMGEQPEEVREVTDLLDAVGNTTKAATKGFAITSAALACFLLFSAFMDEVALFTGKPFKVVDIAKPEVFVGGLLGSMMVMVFSSSALRAVGRAAQKMVDEVRRQFREHPGILAGTQKPDYDTCISIVNKAALAEMVRPGAIAVFGPVAIGFIFKVIGSYRGDVLMGPKALSGTLMFATVSGLMMSLYMNNAGGAWDNAKKLVETGMHGGKNSDAHKAVVTGDTVGDPFKDTAGPSLHVLIKMLSTITLVMCPLFVTSS
eukprot:g2516.t1